MDSDVASDGFPSLNALYIRHRTLLSAVHAENNGDGALLDQIEDFLALGCASGVLFDDDEDRDSAQSLLDYWVATLYGAGRRPSETILADFDPLLAPEISDDKCPYVGLDAFHEEQTGLFYGREHLVNKMVDLLRHRHLIVVVGPSGSGKSSAVLAGLIPALKRGAIAASAESPGSAEWRYPARMVPGSEPLHNLLNLIKDERQGSELEIAAENGEWTKSELALFKADGDHLAELAYQRSENEPVVLVIDQFEEVFTLCTDLETRQAFIDNLLGLVKTAQPHHRVILTIRSDFAGRLRDFRAPPNLVADGTVIMTPLSAPELRSAIERPANAIGLKYEAGLVDALIYDVLGEPAALPLLQFTLLKLWKNRQRNRITRDQYQRLGSGRQALDLSAEALYKSLIDDKRRCMRRILLRLVRPSSESVEVTNNRIRRADLYRMGETEANITDVVQALLDEGLLKVSQGDTAADEQVELAHETLVRSWGRLVKWVVADREEIRKRQQLSDAVGRWHDHGQDPGELLRGALLDEVLNYKYLSDREQEYVDASLLARANAKIESAMASQRELEYVKALADAETERARRLNHFIVIQGAITVLMMIGLILGNVTNLARVFGGQGAGGQTVSASTERIEAVGNSIVDIGVILMLVMLVVLYAGSLVQWSEIRRLYISFQGRVSRSSYWFYFLLPAILLFFALFFFAVMLLSEGEEFTTGDNILFSILGIYCVLFLWTGLAMTAKRLHDRNWSARWLFLTLLYLPLFFGELFLVFRGIIFLLSIPLWYGVYFRKGTIGENRFGADPLEKAAIAPTVSARPSTDAAQLPLADLDQFLTEGIITELEYETIV